MPRGIYPRKKRRSDAGKPRKTKSTSLVVQEIPLEAFPERPAPVQRVQPRVSLEAGLMGLCHRMLDQQQRLMDLIETKRKKGKVKA